MTMFYAPAPFQQVKALSYGLIMADPPWMTKMRSPKGEAKSYVKHYGGMPIDAIGALPVGQLAAKHALLFCWGIWPLVFYGGDPEKHYRDADAARSPIGRVIKEWGFRYVTGGGWAKRTRTGKLRWGPGYRVRSVLEPFFIGVRGSPMNSRSCANLIDGLAREHSRKPDEAFTWCEKWAGDVRRIELFSRQSRPGWDSWGYEAGKFDPVVKLDEAA